MKITDIITSWLLKIFPEISGNIKRVNLQLHSHRHSDGISASSEVNKYQTYQHTRWCHRFPWLECWGCGKTPAFPSSSVPQTPGTAGSGRGRALDGLHRTQASLPVSSHTASCHCAQIHVHTSCTPSVQPYGKLPLCTDTCTHVMYTQCPAIRQAATEHRYMYTLHVHPVSSHTASCHWAQIHVHTSCCLLYTSDAADE